MCLFISWLWLIFPPGKQGLESTQIKTIFNEKTWPMLLFNTCESPQKFGLIFLYFWPIFRHSTPPVCGSLSQKVSSKHFKIINKVKTTNRCEAWKYFNIFKMCPISKYLLVVLLPIGLPNIWSIKFALNIFNYLCFENLILNIDLLCYYVNLILSHIISILYL